MSRVTSNEDRVQEATPDSINSKIENDTWSKVAYYRNRNSDEISSRIKELESEWDIERYLGVNMSTLALAGIATAAFTKKKTWNILPAVVLAFFFQHSVQGWCPPLPILRLLNIRTRKEIEQEKYALKLIRGDFKNLPEPAPSNISQIKQAVQKG